jgi:thiol-disulfide isomerase/thioredoxin
MSPMPERVFHAVAIVLALAVAVTALKHWQKRKANRGRRLLSLEPGKVSVVYFYSRSCGVCRASQKPILDRLLGRVGADKLHLVTVDVMERTDLAREWGVTTVPSIYVIDSAGEVAHVNNGLTSEPTLLRQVSC